MTGWTFTRILTQKLSIKTTVEFEEDKMIVCADLYPEDYRDGSATIKSCSPSGEYNMSDFIKSIYEESNIFPIKSGSFGAHDILEYHFPVPSEDE